MKDGADATERGAITTNLDARAVAGRTRRGGSQRVAP